MSRKAKKVGKRKSSTGKEYERIVATIHRQLDKDATITENEFINGRQVDVAIRKNVAGYEILIIVECKDHRRKMDVVKVDELIGKMEHVRAAKALLVSDSGFTKGARDRAIENGYIELVSVIDIASPRLKTRVGIAIQVESHDLLPPAGPFKLCFDQDAGPILYENAFLDTVKSAMCNFINWHNENTYELPSGKHVHSQEFEYSGHTLRLECTLNKIIKKYINANFAVSGTAAVNHISSTLTFREIGIHINLDDEPSWQKVPEDYTLNEKAFTLKLVKTIDKINPYVFMSQLIEECKTTYQRIGNFVVISANQPTFIWLVNDGNWTITNDPRDRPRKPKSV